MSDCRCRIAMPVRPGTGMDLTIDYCPLHKKAGQMREALEWALDIISVDEAFIASNWPDAWASLNHEWRLAGHQKARAALKED